MKRDPTVILPIALETIQRIEGHVRGQSYLTFSRNRMRQDAVVFRLEMLGLALGDLVKGLKGRGDKESIPKVAGLCAKICEDYRVVDTRLIWQVVSVDLPALKKELSILQPQ